MNIWKGSSMNVFVRQYGSTPYILFACSRKKRPRSRGTIDNEFVCCTSKEDGLNCEHELKGGDEEEGAIFAGNVSLAVAVFVPEEDVE